VAGEGGLLGMVVQPDFKVTHQFVTCQTHQENGRAVDIRLVRWQLADDGKSATKVGVLLSGLPVNQSGRHSGCRPTIAADGALLVGTGDTATADVSQDRTKLGGKVLRLNLADGGPAKGNPSAPHRTPMSSGFTPTVTATCKASRSGPAPAR